MGNLIKECRNCKDTILKTKGNKAWEENRIFVEIDFQSTDYTCGITGIKNLSNVRISKGKAHCSKCDSIIFNEEERRQK